MRMRNQQYQTSGFNQPAELYSVNNWERTDHELDTMPTHRDNSARAFTHLWQDFADAVRQQRSPIASAAAGKRALEIALAGYLSGVTGQTVRLPLDTDNPVYQKGIHGLADVAAWPHSRTQKARIFGLGK
jgi:hypothetical protein